MHGRAHHPRLLVGAHVVDREAGEHGLRAPDERTLAHDQLDALAADHRLELVGGPARDRSPVVDDEHVARELVGLLEVLRGEQQRRAGGSQLADHVPHAEPAARIEARRRLVEEQHRWRGDQCAGEVEPAAHPSGVALHRTVGGIDEVETFEQLDSTPLRAATSQPREPADHHEVLSAGEVLVDGRVLAGQADAGADLVGVRGDVVAGDDRAPLIRDEQRREDPHCRGLAGTVGSEQPEDPADGDLEVEVVERGDRAVALDESLGAHCDVHHGILF